MENKYRILEMQNLGVKLDLPLVYSNVYKGKPYEKRLKTFLLDKVSIYDKYIDKRLKI